jgi:hypothetical protein
MTKHALALAVAVGLLAVRPVAAQEVQLPRFEWGVIGSGFGVITFDGGGAVAGGGPTVTIGLTPRIRIDVIGQFLAPLDNSGLSGLYEAQIRFPLRGSAKGTPSLSMTAGAGGLFSYHRIRERRSPRPDGSIVVFPGYSDVRARPPRMATFGIAHQRIVGGHASLILGTGVMVGEGAIIARASAGVSFSKRRYR